MKPAVVTATKFQADGKAGTDGHSSSGGTSARGVGPGKVSTVSHTLETALADRLREFAFRQRISESAVIEHALILFFSQGDDAALGERLRNMGAALRRKL